MSKRAKLTVSVGDKMKSIRPPFHVMAYIVESQFITPETYTHNGMNHRISYKMNKEFCRVSLNQNLYDFELDKNYQQDISCRIGFPFTSGSTK